LKAAAIVAHEHHKKYDGTGYPRGLKEHGIHIYGRIVAIADVFDALSHPRCYKLAWTKEDAVKYMHDHKGSHFDPKLIELFFSDMAYLENIMRVYADA
jgi:response regulator RpfG family c-di-GMP phosphodiesterase